MKRELKVLNYALDVICIVSLSWSLIYFGLSSMAKNQFKDGCVCLGISYLLIKAKTEDPKIQ